MLEGRSRAAAVAEAARRTLSTAELRATTRLAEVLDEMGAIDLDSAGLDDGEILAAVADAANATDRTLRAAARDAARRFAVTLAASPTPRSSGGRRLVARRARPGDGGDLDVERSILAIVDTAGSVTGPNPHDLWVQGWHDDRLHVCVLLDRSGSMAGERLATAAVAAAACVIGNERTHRVATSLVAFNNRAIVLSSPGQPRSVVDAVDDILTLRGSGATNLAVAARTAARLHSRAVAERHLTVLVSDCAWNDGDDPRPLLRILARRGPLAMLVTDHGAVEIPPDRGATALAHDVGASVCTTVSAGSVGATLAEVVHTMRTG